VKIDGKTYEFVRGSDVERDGMYLEVSVGVNRTRKLIAEVFYSDVTHTMTFTAFQPDISLEVIETLAASARESLPPIEKEVAE
jgi:hypothetical protein